MRRLASFLNSSSKLSIWPSARLRATLAIAASAKLRRVPAWFEKVSIVWLNRSEQGTNSSSSASSRIRPTRVATERSRRSNKTVVISRKIYSSSSPLPHVPCRKPIHQGAGRRVVARRSRRVDLDRRRTPHYSVCGRRTSVRPAGHAQGRERSDLSGQQVLPGCHVRRAGSAAARCPGVSWGRSWRPKHRIRQRRETAFRF